MQNTHSNYLWIPRTWLADGQTHQIIQTINVPATMLPGQYALYLHLPDPNTTVAADTRYAIRLANGGIWPSTNWDGFNSLLHTMEIRLAAGAPTDQVQQSLPMGNISNSSPTFQWLPTNNATEYRVVVYDAGNNVIFADAIFANSSSCNVTTCSATFAGLPFPPGSYFWLIQAQNSYGAGPWSIYP